MTKQAWEVEVEAISENTGSPLERIRAVVILRWMYLSGDLRPLADAILKKQKFDDVALFALACMILDDERVSIDALSWGLPVLYDVVRRFCG